MLVPRSEKMSGNGDGVFIEGEESDVVEYQDTRIPLDEVFGGRSEPKQSFSLNPARSPTSTSSFARAVMAFFALTLWSVSSVASAEPTKIDQGCVAYIAQKTVMFVADVDVSGVHCSPQVKTESRVTDDGVAQLRLGVTVELAGFDSGNSTRDGHVAEALGHPSHRTLSVQTKWFDKKLVNGKLIALPATLRVRGRATPITINARLTRSAGASVSATGSVKTTFSKLKLQVEGVGPGGIVAAPADSLELIFNLHFGLDHELKRQATRRVPLTKGDE